MSGIRPKPLRVCLVGICITAATTAFGETWPGHAGQTPTIWDVAAEPAARMYEQAHRAVEQELGAAERLQETSPQAVRDRLERAIRILRSVHAEEARDVRLRFDLGRVESLRDNHDLAVEALRSALEEAPDHPMALDGYFSLATSYAHLERRLDEIAAYGEYLRRETDPVSRAFALSNCAESEMAIERYTEALRDYVASLDLLPDHAGNRWGYAVALDRMGDWAGSLAQAKIAISLDPLDRELNKPSVFFVPFYDRYWYEGLGAMVRAQLVDDPATAILWWEMALVKWVQYLTAAGPRGLWSTRAEAHRETCERTLDLARRKAAGQTRGR